VTYDGFDTIAEAAAALDDHIADSLPVTGRGHQPIGAGPTPRLGEVVRDAERYLTQAQAILRRDYDARSAPQHGSLHAASLVSALHHVEQALTHLWCVSQVDLPAAGSAVPVRYPTHAGASS
jgi:hypothetical protein